MQSVQCPVSPANHLHMQAFRQHARQLTWAHQPMMTHQVLLSGGNRRTQQYQLNLQHQLLVALTPHQMRRGPLGLP